jgi:hypothetical protein
MGNVGGYSEAELAAANERLTQAFAAGLVEGGRERASIPGQAWVIGLVSSAAIVAFLCLLAWPIGLAVHAGWWFFEAGWNVIG